MPSIAQDIDNYFIDNKDDILNSLLRVKDEIGLHLVENAACRRAEIEGFTFRDLRAYRNQ